MSHDLTKSEFALLRQYEQSNIDLLCDYQINVEHFDGVEKWVELMETYYDVSTGLSPAFDPKYGRSKPAHTGTLVFFHKNDPIGWVVARCDHVDDYWQYIAKGYIWWPPESKTNQPLTGFKRPQRSPEISGAIVHSGGAYIAKAHRKKLFGTRPLSAILVRTMRARCLRRFNADWLTGTLIHDRLAEVQMGTNQYGYTDTGLINEGYYATLERDCNIWLNWISRQDQLSKFEKEISKLGF